MDVPMVPPKEPSRMKTILIAGILIVLVALVIAWLYGFPSFAPRATDNAEDMLPLTEDVIEAALEGDSSDTRPLTEDVIEAALDERP